MARKINIDNALQKRHEYKKKKRKERTVICRILIVCEGERTEPNYFRSFDRFKKGNMVYELTLDGGRINTIGVVDKAISLRDQANVPYDRVWAVFDRDSFPEKNFSIPLLSKPDRIILNVPGATRLLSYGIYIISITG